MSRPNLPAEKNMNSLNSFFTAAGHKNTGITVWIFRARRKVCSLSRRAGVTGACGSSLRPGVFLLLLSFLAASSRGSERAPSQAAIAGTPRTRGAFPLSKFYDTPRPLPRGTPGQLIRSEEFEEYDLPEGVLALSMLYHSRSATDEDVAASGVLLYPDRTPPLGGWPVIAWAHDLNGVARRCAPSLARNLERGAFLSMYVGLGYAVVATDYTGLGTDFRNAYRDIASNARDVLYSIPAAHAAVPKLSSEWIAMGYGEGGLTVVGIAELGALGDPHYLGGIVISDVAGLEPADGASAGNASPLLLAYGIKTVFPDFAEREILTKDALALYPKLDQACALPASAEKVRPSSLLKPNWQKNRFVKQYLERNTIAAKPARGPLLVIASAANAQAPASTTAPVIARMCKQGDQVQFQTYANPDPGYVIGESVRDQIAWIEGRFAGRAAPSNCSGHD